MLALFYIQQLTVEYDDNDIEPRIGEMIGEGNYLIKYGSPKALFASFRLEVEDYLSERTLEAFPCDS